MDVLFLTVSDEEDLERALTKFLVEFKERNPTSEIKHVTAHHRSLSSTFDPGTTYTFFYETK